MKTLTKKTVRGIIRNRGQAIAVTMVVLCGTACYICLASLHRNLQLTRDTYYAQNRFADFEIMVERVPLTTLFKLEDIPGVRQVRGRIVEEVKLEIPGNEKSLTGRIVSMPDTKRNVLNNVVLKSGRYFEGGERNEVIVSDRFADANALEVGDSIRATLDGRQHTLRIVGLGLSPEYVYVIRNVQELVPSPERFGILWVPEHFAETAMNMQEARNNIIGSVDNPDRLDAILEKANDLLDSYGVYAKVKQKDQVSNQFISGEITGLSVTARIVPTVFLGVSSLVILILLNRMVRNERMQIGLMKAYGYSNLSVAAHYLQYALILSGVGCVGGFLLGHWLATQMIKIYVQFYNFPILESRVYPDVLVHATLIALAFALLGAAGAAHRASRIQPAESMRPESPAVGHRVFLERIVLLWRRLSFTWKMIARNVARSKFRSSLNVFGIMISCALIIVGYFSIDGMNYLIDYQFEQTQKQDARVSFIIERGKDALNEAARLDHVRKAEPLLQYPFEVRSEWRTRDMLIEGLPQDAQLQFLFDTEGRRIDVNGPGIILSERIAGKLGVKPGDSVVLKPLMGKIRKEKTVTVSKVIQQYFGSTGYMELGALSRVLDEPFAINAALLRTDPGTEHLLNTQIKKIPGITAIELKGDAKRNLEQTMAQSMSIMSFMTVIFAAVISFSIIYNVTTVTLAERERELASLRVLGFTNAEVGRILYNENFVTGVIGLLLGMPFGMGLCKLMVNAYDTDIFTMPYHLSFKTLVIANVLTIFFIILANLAVRRKIYGLNLVEVLKERE